MQVRHLLAATLLAVTAAGAMAREIDPSETLQAKSLAARELQVAPAEGRTRVSVAEEAREAQAGHAVKVGELADGVAVDGAPHTSWAKYRVKRTYGQTWFNGDRQVVRAVAVAIHD